MGVSTIPRPTATAWDSNPWKWEVWGSTPSSSPAQKEAKTWSSCVQVGYGQGSPLSPSEEGIA